MSRRPRPNPTPFGVHDRDSQALGELHCEIAFVPRNLSLPVFEPVAPHLSCIAGVDELGTDTDTNPIAGTAHLTLNYVAHIQRSTDSARIDGLALVLGCGTARTYKCDAQIPPECHCEVLCERIGELLIGGIA